MKKNLSAYLIQTLILCLVSIRSFSFSGKDPVDYVDPYIGSIGHLLTATTPDVQMPRGMIRVIPATTPGIRDTYLADKIFSFSTISLSNDFSRGHGGFSIMATTGEPESEVAACASRFDHTNEIATPYYYAVTLEDHHIEAEYSVSTHSAIYRFTYPETGKANIVIRLARGAEYKLLEDRVLEGSQDYPRGGDPRRKLYFHAEFHRPVLQFGCLESDGFQAGTGTKAGERIAFFATWPALREKQVLLKVGYSFLSHKQAAINLQQEISGWDLEAIKNRGRQVWNEALGRIQVTGGSEKERTMFYTALYRVFGRKTTNISEYGRYFSGLDYQVHDTADHDFYQLGESWGSFRSLFPLGLILEPERQNDLVRSYLRMYEQKGWLGDAALESRVMTGWHETCTIADAYRKGFRDYDVEKVYEALKKNLMQATKIPWRNGPATELDRVYLQKGFFPALALGQKEWVPQVDRFEKRQAVAVTLESCIDDWCLAQLAKALNQTDDYRYFLQRSLNYRNLWDDRIGFMAPKTADGDWVFDEKQPLDPIWSGGQGGRDYYTETNAWTYTFHVPHDVPGLISLMGGKEPFVKKLDALFTEQFGGKGAKFDYLKQFPDSTGLIGQYNHGNQPGFHIAYLYNYAGKPWMTQKRVRDILNLWYNDGPLGICGDEDEGELSSWYVFSAMGFYPVCPGNPSYDIGSPLFQTVKINLGNGRTFTIEAQEVSEKNKYIQSATLNGRPLSRPWFTHQEMTSGGRLVLRMGRAPNKTWGSDGAKAEQE